MTVASAQWISSPASCERKAQWPPCSRLDKRDVRVGEQLGAGLRQQPDERIVERVQDKRGHGDAVDYACAGGAVVVVVSIAKAAVARHDLIVKFAQ